MAVPMHILEAMRGAGCTLDQVLAVLRADVAERSRRRELRRVSKMNEHDSRDVNEPDSESWSSAPKLNEHDSIGVGEPPEPQVYGNRKTIARMALLTQRGLRLGARLVAAQLVEHSNLRTGRCDPSIGRIARLTGLSARSVSRSIGELVAAGLMRVSLHGGWSHRNAYVLDWGALGLAATGGMNDHDSAATTTLASADHDSGVVQNLSQNPDRDRGRGEIGARETGPPRQRELPLMRSLPGGKSKGEAAYGAAGTRLWGDLKRHGTEAQRKPLFDLVIADPTLLEAATLAEVRARGGGLGLLIETMEGGAAGLRKDGTG